MEKKWLSDLEFRCVVGVLQKSRESLAMYASDEVSESLDSGSLSEKVLTAPSVSYALTEVLREMLPSSPSTSAITLEKMPFTRGGLDRWIGYALFESSVCTGFRISDDAFNFLMRVLRRSHDRLYNGEVSLKSRHAPFKEEGWSPHLPVSVLHDAVSTSVSFCSVHDELGFVTAYDELVGVEAIIEYVSDLLQLERVWLVPSMTRPSSNVTEGDGIFISLTT